MENFWSKVEAETVALRASLWAEYEAGYLTPSDFWSAYDSLGVLLNDTWEAQGV
jgi:hypothetical protein